MVVDFYTHLLGGPSRVALVKDLGYAAIAVFGTPGEEPVVIPRTDVVHGIELIPVTKNEVRRDARAFRRSAELIAVRTQDPEIVRTALSIPEVDFLVAPWEKQEDAGVNHILCKLAKKNNIAIVFDFAPLLRTARRHQAALLAQYRAAAQHVRKAKAPFVLASGAVDQWELRSVSDLTAFGKVLGFPENDIKHSFSDVRVKENRKRLRDKNWIRPGVELQRSRT